MARECRSGFLGKTRVLRTRYNYGNLRFNVKSIQNNRLKIFRVHISYY